MFALRRIGTKDPHSADFVGHFSRKREKGAPARPRSPSKDGRLSTPFAEEGRGEGRRRINNL
jgi:hypothetical protein